MKLIYRRLGKRLLDISVACLGLIFASPLMMLISLWIKIDSRGPITYRSTRVGRWGEPFEVLKFRTMVVQADHLGPSSTAGDDPRITRVGHILRAYKLDELPQLINVFRGELSLVGPRPQVPWAVDLYTREEKEILDIRPGMTDYAYVLLPDEAEVLLGSKNPDGDYLKKIHPLKMRLSAEYLKSYSFLLDAKILVDSLSRIATGRSVFFRRQRDMHMRDLKRL